ncbi:MAG: hypothetical protein FWG79_03475 [Bacteroidales bacterium]|nr:hypothetical protein [Bacteroidales bacterium]
MEKSNYNIEPHSDDINMVSEPEMAYNYTNQTDCESILIGKFNSVEGFAVDKITPRPQKILQPDDNLRRAITFDELLVGVKEDLREMFMQGK